METDRDERIEQWEERQREERWKSWCGSGVENKDRGRNYAHTYSSIILVSSKAEMLADTEARV